ncbi:MAG: metalloregulator ArsR/SmtB family transcription factor [Candidatus Aminicenantales bacterium]
MKIFKSLSDPTRLRILLLLLQRELCVCELTFILEMEQSRISHQLKVLRNADLVEDIRDGKWIIYRISEDKKKYLMLILNPLIGEDLAYSKEIKKDNAKLQVFQKNSIRNCPVSFERREV